MFPIVLAKSLETNPEFLIDVGDLIEGGTENPLVLDTQWNEYMNIVKDVEIPFYHTPGNHDLWFQGQMKEYLARIGKPYYSFDIHNIHFVILDNSRWTPDSINYLDDIQINWLINDLKNNRQQFTFVFCHIPFWDQSIRSNTLVNNPLHTLLLSQKVDLVVAGHYHNYFKTDYDGMTYIIAGRAGAGSTVGHLYFKPKDIRYKASDFEDHRFLTVTVQDNIKIESHIVTIE